MCPIPCKTEDELTGIAERLLSEQTPSSGKYRDTYYYTSKNSPYVSFDIGAQGFLGGQYRSLVYCPSGTFQGHSETFLWYEPDGNNIIRAEKLDGPRWYYRIDYDGRDLSEK